MTDKKNHLTKREFATIKQLELQGLRLDQRKAMIPIERVSMVANHENQLDALDVELSQSSKKKQELTDQVANIMEIATGRSGD